jgi:hypothetical protein
LAVVIVIALVVINAIGGFPSIGSNSSKRASDFKLATEKIGVVNYNIGSNYSTFVLKNNNFDTVVVSEFRLNNNENLTCGYLTTLPSLPVTLNIGESKLITCTAVNSSNYQITNKQSIIIGILFHDLVSGFSQVAGNVHAYGDVQRDVLAPAFSIYFPLNSQTYSNYSNNSFVNYTVSDLSGIDYVKICDDTVCYNDTVCQNQTICSAVYSGLNASVGTHLWNVTAYDKAGNYDFSSINFIIYVPDLSAPAGSILYPADYGNYSNLLNLSYMNISAADDFNLSYFRICGNENIFTNESSCYIDYTCQNLTSCILQFSGLNYSIGNNSWNLTVYDITNNSNFSQIHFNVYIPDLTTPNVSISYPVSGQDYTTVNFLNYTVSDDQEISYVTVCDGLACYNDSTCLNQLSCNGSYTGLNYQIGSNTWNITVFDTSSNFNNASSSFDVIPFVLICDQQNAQGFYNGTGTLSSPFGICSWTQLNKTRNYLTSNFTLLNNLDSTSVNYSGLGNNWTPIGSTFTGIFDGNGKTISNLTIYKPTTDGVGLFSLANGSILNIGLQGVNIIGRDYVGGLVGGMVSASPKISNSFVTGNISGVKYVGGIIGYAWGVTIENSSSSGLVNGTYGVAGLVGLNRANLTLNNCSSSSQVTGGSYVGPFVGVGGSAYDPVTSPVIHFAAGKWHFISWPYSNPRYEEDGDNKGWGFAASGATKSTSWMFSDQLVGSSGVTIQLNTDGRWHASNGSIYSTEVLNAGTSYYYYAKNAFNWTINST